MALGVLNDALGLSAPVLAVRMVAERLCRHLVWAATLAFLATARIDTMDPADGDLTLRPRCIPSGPGEDIADNFDPELLV